MDATPSPDLLVIGSVAYDTVETPKASAERIMGGSASFFSTAAARFCRPVVVAVVGDDYEDEHLARLERAGVDLQGLKRVPGKTFFWHGRYGKDFISRDTLTTELGVFEEFDPVVPEALKRVPYLFLANIAPHLQLQVLDQLERPRFVGLDTMNLWIDIARDDLHRVLSRVDALFVNDEEAEQLTGFRSVLRAARALQDMGPRVVVIKRGEHGALTFAGDDVFFAPAYPLEDVHDPTGAGDTYAGGFMGFLASSGDTSVSNLRQASVVGTLMASFCVEGFSLDGLDRAELPEVWKRYEELRKLTAIDPPPVRQDHSR
jgi:sugar/nucleoside kinase (ribokinase family)